MLRKQVFLEQWGTAKVQLYVIRTVLWKSFLHVNFKDGSCKEQQTAVMALNITGEEKERKWTLWLHILHWEDIDWGICCFFWCKMKLEITHMIAFEATIREVVGHIWGGIVVGSPMSGKTTVMKGSKLFSEFQEKHSPIYLVLFVMIYNTNTFVKLQFCQKKG